MYKAPLIGRQGELMLQICSINDQKRDKWLLFFSPEEIDWLLNTPKGKKLCKSNPQFSDKVFQALKAGASVSSASTDTEMVGVISEGSLRAPVREIESDSFSPIPTLEVARGMSIQGFSGTITDSYYKIQTDKGEFYSVPTLLQLLEPLYAVEGFSEIANQAMVDIKVSPNIQYISSAKKKAMISKLDVLVKNSL